MTDERTERRIAALEAEIARGRRARQDSARRAQAAEREADAALLRIDPLAASHGLSEGAHDKPDLGRPLLRRLERGFGYDDAGSSDLHSANTLLDPLMETATDSAVTVGSSWTSVGDEWEARVRNISGTSPTVTARRTHRRKVMEGHIYKSDILVLDSEFSAVGKAWVELRTATATPAPVHIDWPWHVVAARVYVDKQIREWTNLTDDEPEDYDASTPDPDFENYVRMAIVNDSGGAGDFDNPDATGDEIMLKELSDDKMEGQVYVGTETVDETHHWLLQINLASEGAGGVAVAVAEPQANYSYQEAPMPFEPDVGNYDPPRHPLFVDVPISGLGVDEDSVSLIGSPITADTESYLWRAYDSDGDDLGYGASGYVLRGGMVGSEAGTEWTHFASPPDGCTPCGIHSGWITDAVHRARKYRYTMPDLSGLGADGLRFALDVEVYSGAYTDGSHSIGHMASIYLDTTEPTAFGDGDAIGTLLAPASETQFVFYIDAADLPAAGQTFWLMVEPTDLSNVGVCPCNGDWPAYSGRDDSWGIDLDGEEVQAASWDTTEIDDGALFRYHVAQGDGSTTDFTGLPTYEDSCRWLINGVDTVPSTYDHETGDVSFEIAPGYLARVEQIGYYAA